MAYSNMYFRMCILYLYFSLHCVYLSRITCVCMYIQRDVPHPEQCLQIYIQACAEIVSHGKHCLWCLISYKLDSETVFKSPLLICNKSFYIFRECIFFAIASSLFLDMVFSVYWAGFSDITQNLEMHEQVSLTMLLHQCCTWFNSITLAKLIPLFSK